MFKEPVEILPNVNYTACATLKVCVAFLIPDTHAALSCFKSAFQSSCLFVFISGAMITLIIDESAD